MQSHPDKAAEPPKRDGGLIAGITAVCLIFASAPVAQAEEAEWQRYYRCVRIHVEDVASVIQSLDEGAALISEVLCMDEATAVANAMMRQRGDGGQSVGARFSSFLTVVLRETRGMVYQEKRLQAGH